ncbi:MAG: MopE-related protein, partial [Myxococcota bacterium]|nr:MopE-related protein [Myxococcota bacterium]
QDCDDEVGAISPSEVEAQCNGIDDDCDESTPDDEDADGDGSGVCDGDCDDSDPARWNDCPDCDVTGAPGCPCAPGEARECYEGPAGTVGVGICAAGLRHCVGGYLADECEGQVLPVAFEWCGDGADNDCNGIGDREAFGPCGDCDATCRSEGSVEPSPRDPDASGVMDNPDGPGIVLGSEEIQAGFLWASNSPEGTVSKLDLATGAEVARYRVGSDPSRTAVDSVGNAYVADRGGSGAAKMAGDRRYCVDRNGNTVIDTSTGPAPLPFGADECVLWRVPLGSPGALPRAVAVDFGDAAHPEGYPWVGVFHEMRGYKLHPDTGAVLEAVDLQVNTYGFAIDSNGWIWISGRGPGPYIQRFHTVTRAVEPRIPFSGCGDHPYGITVDVRNRVWVASWFDGQACAARYDPATGAWFAVNTRGGWGARGIAADADGTIWLSIHANWCCGAIASFHMDDGSGLVVRDIAGVIPVGIGVDELGHVWTVNQTSRNVTRLTKATGALEQFPVGPDPYTYSDFTGYQRRMMIPRGTWTRDFERCATDSFDRWGVFVWDADVPAGARLAFSATSAPARSGLGSAPSVTPAVVPSDAPPVDITAAFAAAGVPLHRFLRVTALLEASPDRHSPVLRSVDVRWHCYRMP